MGSQHPHVACSYNNLAIVLGDQGDLKQAKEYHERALAIRQQTFGPRDPDVATSYNNLAIVLGNQGELKQAKEYHERGLAIKEKTLGPQHPDVADSYNNLAIVLGDQGDLKQAEEYDGDEGDLKKAKKYHQRALAIRQQFLGPQHPNVASSCNNLAIVLGEQADLKEAKEYYERALAIREETSGPQHPDVFSTSYENLAIVLGDQDDLQPRSQGLLRFQDGGREKTLAHTIIPPAKYSKNRGVFCHVTQQNFATLDQRCQESKVAEDLDSMWLHFACFSSKISTTWTRVV